MRLKCLSIQQPWCDLILAGRKRVENRSWRTAYTGLLGIHASRGLQTWNRLGEDRLDQLCPGWRAGERPVTGAVLGVVDLVACVRYADLPAELRGHEFAAAAADNWCWVLANPRPLARPFPAAGNAAFFHVEVPDELLPGLGHPSVS
jgi:hypothetical protein